MNPEQQAAVDHGDGPLMLLAGAGTGKTRVLVHRVARLVESGASPWSILAVTFTNKAAGEMRHRLRELLGDAAESMWIGTFHATCAKLLRKFGDYVGLTRNFVIFDDDDQVKLVDRILKQTEMDEQVSARAVLSRIDRAKNRGEDPAALTGHLSDVVREVYPRYQAQLAQENAVDFNDLLLKTAALFDHPPAARVLRTKFQHVLVDEFQDTNRVQYQLIWKFAEATRNLTVVGDDDQSIYAWRGAEPRNLLDFDEDCPDARVVKLEQNYRSTQTILDVANAVIRVNLERHDKSLWTALEEPGRPIEIYQASDERDEASFVAQAIRGMVQGGRRAPADVAVLYRTNAQARVIDEHLRAARVPARVVGAVSFFERKEVKDVVAYLRLLVNPTSDQSVERVINVPARGIGDATVDKLRAAARSGKTSMLDAARKAAGGGVPGVGPAPRNKLQVFVDLVDELVRAVASETSVSETVVRVIERSGLRAKLESDESEESRDRLEHLAELVTAAADFDTEHRAAQAAQAARVTGVPPADVGGVGGSGAEADGFLDPAAPGLLGVRPAPTAADDGVPASPPTVVGFLERLALSSAADADSAQQVSLMTIHVAKGLEWPVVFVVGMEDGLFPSLREREGTSDEDSLEEERRLAYVAITRAREHLIVSHARTRRTWGEVRMQQPSRFLDDFPPKTLARPNLRRNGSRVSPEDD